jgi:5'-nucleotidase
LPDLVVSGINAGLNAGLGFILSSGTVGACFEANIAGVPAIALSQALDDETRNRYLVDYSFAPETFERLRRQTVPHLDLAFDRLRLHEGGSSEPITWNFNLPFVAQELGFVPVSVGHSWYGSCFQPDDLGYTHQLRSITYDPRPTTDIGMLRAGRATVTPIDLRSFGQLSPQREADLGIQFGS